MGEIADLMIDRHINRSPPRDRYIGRFRCRHCGAPDLYWQNVRGRWLPHSRETLAQHVCPKPDDRTTEGFGDVD